MGFSADWLALREPADQLARDKSLLQKAVSVAGENPVILDLGCGTGSTVRALSPFLKSPANWRLVDNDNDLLEIAGAELDTASLHLLDIKNLDDLPLEGVRLITASALLDLVTESWLRDFLERVNIPVYFALSYDGVMSWTPEHPDDKSITESFNIHQQTDKGMGKALGPNAAELATEILESSGFDVFEANSPWVLGHEQHELHQSLIAGIAQAASEVGNINANSWASYRNSISDEFQCIVGHKDILAVPAGWQGEVDRAIS